MQEDRRCLPGGRNVLRHDSPSQFYLMDVQRFSLSRQSTCTKLRQTTTSSDERVSLRRGVEGAGSRRKRKSLSNPGTVEWHPPRSLGSLSVAVAAPRTAVPSSGIDQVRTHLPSILPSFWSTTTARPMTGPKPRRAPYILHKVPWPTAVTDYSPISNIVHLCPSSHSPRNDPFAGAG